MKYNEKTAVRVTDKFTSENLIEFFEAIKSGCNVNYPRDENDIWLDYIYFIDEFGDINAWDEESIERNGYTILNGIAKNWREEMETKYHLFKVSDNVVLKNSPLDEQLGEMMPLGKYKIIEVKDVSNIEGTSGQWVKVNGRYNDWLDSSYFELQEEIDIQSRIEQLESENKELRKILNNKTTDHDLKEILSKWLKHNEGYLNIGISTAFCEGYKMKEIEIFTQAKQLLK